MEELRGAGRQTVDWTFQDETYDDELALARAILAGEQPAIVQLGPLIVRVWSCPGFVDT